MTLLDPREAQKDPCAEGGTIAAGTGFPKLEYPVLPKNVNLKDSELALL